MKMFSILIMIFLLGFDPRAAHPAAESPPPWIKVFFSPGDDLAQVLSSLINSSSTQLWAAFYSLNHPRVAAELLAAAERGVDVRIVMDNAAARDRHSRARQFLKAGLLVTDLAPGDFMHNKFMIIDHTIVATGSCNPTITGVSRDNNNLVLISSRQLAQIYQEEFVEMWKGKFGTLSPESGGGKWLQLNQTRLEIFFSPEEDCAQRLISLIEEADQQINFACFAFTLPEVAEALIEKKEEGIRVRGVLEQGQNSPYNVYRLLEDAGLDVAWDQNLHYLHHKFFVIDDQITATGSFNPSRHARQANDENMLVIHDRGVAALFNQEFKRLRQRPWE